MGPRLQYHHSLQKMETLVLEPAQAHHLSPPTPSQNESHSARLARFLSQSFGPFILLRGGLGMVHASSVAVVVVSIFLDPSGQHDSVQFGSLVHGTGLASGTHVHDPTLELTTGGFGMAFGRMFATNVSRTSF